MRRRAPGQGGAARGRAAAPRRPRNPSEVVEVRAPSAKKREGKREQKKPAVTQLHIPIRPRVAVAEATFFDEGRVRT